MVWFSWFCEHVRIFGAISCCFLLKIPSYMLVSSQETRSWFPTSLVRQLARFTTVNLEVGHFDARWRFQICSCLSLYTWNYMAKWSNLTSIFFRWVVQPPPRMVWKHHLFQKFVVFQRWDAVRTFSWTMLKHVETIRKVFSLEPWIPQKKQSWRTFMVPLDWLDTFHKFSICALIL